MIFIHLLLGIILGKLFGNYFAFILGSILPDIDHIYIIIKNKLWSIKKIVSSIKYEKKYNLEYKTPFMHSIFGLIIFIAFAFLFNFGVLEFGIAYLLHLLVDWLDTDVKYFLYPFRIRFKGFLPIWSKTEKIATIMLVLICILLFLI